MIRKKVFHQGRFVGTYMSESELESGALDEVKKFLVAINKGKENEQMAVTNNEKCNMAWIAGTLKTVKVERENAFFLVDTSADSRFIPCTIFKSSDLCDKLARFRQDDFIAVKGFVRAWSKKQDGGEWKNNVEIRITEIACKIPDRAAAFEFSKQQGPPRQQQRKDDEVPF